MSRKAELLDIIKCCELRFNRGAAAAWKHSDFTDLSQEIRVQTKVLISANTLKRIFGKISVDDDYQPQQATLDALKLYGGYEPGLAEPSTTHTEKPVIKTVKASSAVFTVRNLFIAAVFIIGLGALLLFTMYQRKSIPEGSIRLTATEGLLPATAFFETQLSGDRDSVFVNFGDKSPLVYVKPGTRTLSHNYLFPGVFNISLQTGGNKSIASTKIAVRSDNWIGLGFHNQRELPKRYYEFPAVKTGDSLYHLSKAQLFAAGLDTSILFYTRLCNYTPLTVKSDPDNFIFEAVLKNRVNEKAIYCNGVQFQIAGIDHFIRFKLISPGCSNRVLNILSEQNFEGAKNNLSQFAVNLREWTHVKLINQDKKVSLFVNDKLIFSGQYQVSIGEIQGLFIEFEGTGYVKSCELRTPDGKGLYHF